MLELRFQLDHKSVFFLKLSLGLAVLGNGRSKVLKYT